MSYCVFWWELENRMLQKEFVRPCLNFWVLIGHCGFILPLCLTSLFGNEVSVECGPRDLGNRGRM